MQSQLDDKNRVQVIFERLIFAVLFLIPMAWSTKVNANYYTTKTFLLYLVGGLSFFYTTFWSDEDSSQSLKSFFKWSSFIFIGAQSLAFALAPWPESLFLSAKFFSSFGLFLYLKSIKFDLKIFLKKYNKIFLLFLILMVGLTGQNLVRSSIENETYLFSMLLVPFGNVNMLAEFYVLLVPFIYFWVRSSSWTEKNRAYFVLKTVLLILVNFFIVLSRSRSAYMGVTLWWLLLIHEHFFKVVRWRIKISLLLMVSGLCLFLFAPQWAENFANKAISTSERTNFYKSSWALIKDHPLGIGHGYINQVVPYRLSFESGPNELDYPDQPHSEILKWGIQFGWSGLILALATLAAIGWSVFRKRNLLLQGFYLVLVPQLFFQFPFENPASILILTVGLYLFYQSVTVPTSHFKTPRIRKLIYENITLVLSLGLMWTAYAFVSSVYWESNYPDDLQKTKQACDLNPTNLRACIRKNYSLLALGDYQVLAGSLKADTLHNYYASDYLKLLSSITQAKMPIDPQKQSSSIEKNCQILKVYAFIYKDQNYFRAEDLKLCDKVLMPVTFQSAQQFDHDYKIWYMGLLDEYLK